jgi:tripeptidyl-peptidase-1
VGGTQFSQTSHIGNETTWADGGGGFSNTYARPAYQDDAVAGYLASGKRTLAVYLASGAQD